MQYPDITIRETIRVMKKTRKSPISGKPKFPNNLLRLMQRDGVTQADIARVWNVENGDASQRVSGKVRVTPERAKMLTDKFGWSYAEIYGDDILATNDLRDSEIALMDAIKDILIVMLHHKLCDEGYLSQAFNSQHADYQAQGSQRAMLIMKELEEFVSGKLHRSEKEIIGRLLHTRPLGSA